jgi:hypothetical protein
VLKHLLEQLPLLAVHVDDNAFAQHIAAAETAFLVSLNAQNLPTKI